MVYKELESPSGTSLLYLNVPVTRRMQRSNLDFYYPLFNFIEKSAHFKLWKYFYLFINYIIIFYFILFIIINELFKEYLLYTYLSCFRYGNAANPKGVMVVGALSLPMLERSSPETIFYQG